MEQQPTRPPEDAHPQVDAPANKAVVAPGNFPPNKAEILEQSWFDQTDGDEF